MAQLGANALGEVLEPGRVPDCYLGLRLDLRGQTEPAGVLVVAPASLLHPAVPQPDGAVLYELVTGHPDRAPRELVFLADLTVELRAWPTDTWSKVGIDPQAAARAVVAGWQHGDLPGLRLGGLTAEEALALERPGHDLRACPARRPAAAPAHPRVPSVAAPDEWTPSRRPVPVAAATRRPRQCRGGHQPSGHRPRFRKQQRTADTAAVSSAAASRTAPGAAVSAVDSGRPGQHLAALADPPRTLPRCPVRWTPAGVPGQVGAAGGHRRSGGADSGRGWWTLAACRRRAVAAGHGSSSHRGANSQVPPPGRRRGRRRRTLPPDVPVPLVAAIVGAIAGPSG
jgi:hypothetical protein